MDFVIVGLLVGLCGAVLAIALALRPVVTAARSSSLDQGDAPHGGGPTATVAAASGGGSDDGHDDGIEVRADGGALELWWPGGTRLATIRPIEATASRRVAGIAAPWARRAAGTLVRRAVRGRHGAAPVRGGTYRISVPPDLLDTLQRGGTLDLVVGSGAPLVARGVAGAGGPVAALTVGALATALAQQQRLDQALAVIESRIDLIIDRLRDDDHGRIDAAEALLAQLEDRRGDLPPSQLRAELAAARHGIDTVYFARRRFAERLGDAIGDAQSAAEARDGEVETWAAGVLDAVGDPDQLRSELLVYLRALVVRARLATTTSKILAVDGDVDAAHRLLDTTVAELRRDFYGVYRRLRPLAQWPPRRSMPWRRREWERAHTAVVEVFELMAGEVEPRLPAEVAPVLELEAVVDDEGTVTDVTIVEP